MERLKTTVEHLVLCFLLCCCTVNSMSGNDNYPLGARSAGLATSSVTVTDVWSSVNNQAGLGYLEQVTAALYYESRLNVKTLSIQAGALAIPVGTTIIGINYRHFGFPEYNESKFGLAVGKKLGDKFALGVQADYFHTHYPSGYGNFGNLCAEIGLLCEPVEHLVIGTHVFNPSRARQSASPEERIPTIMRFGAGYTIHNKATVSLETEKAIRMKAVFKVGLEFTPVTGLFLRCGASTGPTNQYAFGLGYVWKRFAVDLAFGHHRILGYNPQVSIIAKL